MSEAKAGYSVVYELNDGLCNDEFPDAVFVMNGRGEPEMRKYVPEGGAADSRGMRSGIACCVAVSAACLLAALRVIRSSKTA